MKMTILLLLSLTIHFALGDIPDNVLDSGVYEVIEQIGDDHLIDVTFSEEDSVTSCFGYSLSGDDTKFWILKIDYSGIPVDRHVLNIQHDGSADRISGVFSEHGLIVIIDGDDTPGSYPEYLSFDLLNPDNSTRSALQVEVAPDEILTLQSPETCTDGQLLAAGTRWSPENGHSLCVIKLGQHGTIYWETPLVENYEEQIISATLGILSDGGCILSYSLDCSPSFSIPICRLGSDGRILRQGSLQVDCEFVAGISDFLELDNGNIICAGTIDEMGQMAYRGLTVCLDREGEELWRRIDWYLDHTLFRCAGITQQGDLLISGRTGEEGDYPFKVVNADVLLGIMADDGSRIIGTEFTAEGDQKTHSVFITKSGQIIVTGTVVQRGQTESDVFFLKTGFDDLQ